jgi:hypothetical protein
VIEDSQREEFAALGATVPKREDTRESDAIEIWDINWPSFMAFLDCGNQWRVVAGFGFVSRLGLEWPAVDILIKRRGLGDREFEDLVVMETAALKTFSENDS